MTARIKFGGSGPQRTLPASASKSARGQNASVWTGRPATSGLTPILLQKSFYIDQHKFSGPRRSNNHLRAYIICNELIGDFGNGLEATSVGNCCSFCQFARN
jgi:hypothetical protein